MLDHAPKYQNSIVLLKAMSESDEIKGLVTVDFYDLCKGIPDIKQYLAAELVGWVWGYALDGCIEYSFAGGDISENKVFIVVKANVRRLREEMMYLEV